MILKTKNKKSYWCKDCLYYYYFMFIKIITFQKKPFSLKKIFKLFERLFFLIFNYKKIILITIKEEKRKFILC